MLWIPGLSEHRLQQRGSTMISLTGLFLDMRRHMHPLAASVGLAIFYAATAVVAQEADTADTADTAVALRTKARASMLFAVVPTRSGN